MMTSECKGGGKFVGKWSVSVRNTTSCPVCRLPQPVTPYGGRYTIADHLQPESGKCAQSNSAITSPSEIESSQADTMGFLVVLSTTYVVNQSLKFPQREFLFVQVAEIPR